ncbi:hypothetical protein [Atlantibacter sp. RC6]|uniref:hypothetical protein n=1 Tax=Atlantibacter sp. RC6 TaxID=2587036 RepID=UPI001605E1FE
MYKTLTTGKMLAKAVFKFYRINYNGQEEEYFVTTPEIKYKASTQKMRLYVRVD